MTVRFGQALWPPSPATIARATDAARTVAQRLKRLSLEKLDVSDYTRRYLGDYLVSVNSVLDRYAFILAWALAPSDIAGRPATTLLDYGGGSGVMTLMARAAGLRTVIYDDVYATSAHDAKVIADSIDLAADHYLVGEIDDVITFCRQHDLNVDVVANNDVIEHIYDMATFVRKLPELSSGPLTVSLATGANLHNPFVRRLLERNQHAHETVDSQLVFGHKDRDSLRAYRTIRREIIGKADPLLDDEAVGRLAEATRGMMRRDIEASVERFRLTGRLPAPPSHPTNTCDPENGNWNEHLMNTGWLREEMTRAGFITRILPGAFGVQRRLVKKLGGALLDAAMAHLGDNSLALAPYIVAHGVLAN